MNLYKNNKAAAVVEFAIIAPVLALLLSGMFGIYELFHVELQMEKIAARIGLLASADPSPEAVASYINISSNLASSISFSEKGAILVSSLTNGANGNGNPVLISQMVPPGITATSIIDDINPDLPGTLNYTTIVVEVFYDYSSFFGIIPSRLLRKYFCIDQTAGGM
jgi:hypothetical protein